MTWEAEKTSENHFSGTWYNAQAIAHVVNYVVSENTDRIYNKMLFEVAVS